MASTDENPGLGFCCCGMTWRRENCRPQLRDKANAAQFPELAARAQASDEILACAAEQLEIYNRVHDARLFGIRADGGVIFSLVSLAVTFYVFVFFWMFGIDAGR